MAYTKSEKGQLAFKNRSLGLSARQRSAFILFDGKRSVQDVLTATAGLGVTTEDIASLAASGMLEDNAPGLGFSATMPATVGNGLTVSPPVPAEPSQSTPQERYQRAYLIATQLTAGLGLRGFRLNLAVESAGSYEKLLELAPKIREAVGEEKFVPLGLALSE